VAASRRVNPARPYICLLIIFVLALTTPWDLSAGWDGEPRRAACGLVRVAGFGSGVTGVASGRDR
jgi:hypothetical protein